MRPTIKLIKTLINLAFIGLVFWLLLINTNINMDIRLPLVREVLKVGFWQIVIFCISLGVIIAAIGDFITQIKWMREKRRMLKTDRDHTNEVNILKEKIQGLESENSRLKAELEKKPAEVAPAPKPDIEIDAPKPPESTA